MIKLINDVKRAKRLATKSTVEYNTGIC